MKFREKEKLTKNHYKGFDIRMKYTSIAALGALVLSLAVFLPLTYHTEVAAEEARQHTIQEEANKDSSSKVKGRYILEF